MKKKRIIGALIGAILFFLPCAETAFAGPFEKGPVLEPKTESPFVIKNSQGKPVFEEYFEEREPLYEKYYLGNEITGFKLLDPSTGEVMLDVAMEDGVLSREIEGTAKDKGEEEKSPFSSIVHAKYVSDDGTLIFKMSRIGENILGYRIIEDVGKKNTRGLRVMALEKGRIRRSTMELYSGDRPWQSFTLNYEGFYKEATYPQGGGYQERVFKDGLLTKETRMGQNEALFAWYHRGKLGFWEKHLYRDGNVEMIEIYDETDKLVDIVKIVFGEFFDIDFEDRKGKPVKIFRKKRGKKVIREVVREMGRGKTSGNYSGG